MHPVCSIAAPNLSITTLTGVRCALEGDAGALDILTPLLTSIGFLPFLVTHEHKALYHAGSVFAANYLVTLAEQARLCFEQAGIEHALINPLVHQLMHSSLFNLTRVDSPTQALTGPLQRGDAATVEAHLSALSPQQRACYLALARATLPLITPQASLALAAVFDEQL
jgi:predicted short-subunit dehydrogenase-like oxidoreductase (DUF2520 family)